MKKTLLILTVLMATLSFGLSSIAVAYNYGDYRSETLVSKAWQALGDDDIEAVLAYTNKCIELYAGQAQKMQDSLTEYPIGENKEIFGYWALNDVATSLFIQGEIYRKREMYDEAQEAYQRVVDEFKYGQCWDSKGWFWKPAEAAGEKLVMLETGTGLDFGDYTSSHLANQAWKALADGDLDAVNAYVDKSLELYGDKAKEMQESLTEYPWENKEKIFTYWALNDIGTILYVQGEAYRNAGETEKAKEAYQKLVDEYFFSQCWDPNGWFWKPAEAGQQKLDEMGA